MSHSEYKFIPVIIVSLFFLSLSCSLPTQTLPSPENLTETASSQTTPIAQGPTPTAEPTLTPRPEKGDGGAGCTYRAQLKSSSLTHGANLTPSQSFTQTWNIANTGTCPWQEVSLQWAGGNKFNSSPKEWELPSTAPDDTARLTLNMKAPGKSGTFRGDWQLVDPDGESFGPQTLAILVQVSSSSQRPHSSSQKDGSKQGGGLFPPIANGVLGNLDRILGPDISTLPFYIKHPLLASQMGLNAIPDLGGGQTFPDDSYYIDHPPLDQLDRFGLNPLSGSSDKPKLGDPPTKKGVGTPPKGQDKKLAVTINGTLKVSEYKLFKQRNMSGLPFNSPWIRLGDGRPTARFKVTHCEGGNNNKGEESTVIIGIHRTKDNKAWLGVHHAFLPAINCKNGNPVYDGTFHTGVTLDEFKIRISPGESKRIARPWKGHKLAGSSKLILEVHAQTYEGPIRQGDWVTQRKE